MSKAVVKAAPGLGPIDKKLVRLAAQKKSLVEISKEIGGVLTPAECGARINDILDSRDWLSVLNQKRLILDDAAWLANKLHSQIDKMEYVNKDDAAVYIRSLKELLGMINDITMQDEATMMRIAEVHARIIAGAIRVGFEDVLARLDVPEQDAYIVLEEAMPAAFNELVDGHG